MYVSMGHIVIPGELGGVTLHYTVAFWASLPTLQGKTQEIIE